MKISRMTAMAVMLFAGCTTTLQPRGLSTATQRRAAAAGCPDSERDPAGNLQCLIEALETENAALKRRVQHPPRQAAPRRAPGAVMPAVFQPAGELELVPTGLRYVAMTEWPRGVPEGLVVYQTGDSPVGLRGFACAFRGGINIPIQGNGVVRIILDANGDGRGEGRAYACVPTGTQVFFPAVAVGERVELRYYRRSSTSAAVMGSVAVPVHQLVWCGQYNRTTALDGGWAGYHSAGGSPCH